MIFFPDMWFRLSEAAIWPRLHSFMKRLTLDAFRLLLCLLSVCPLHSIKLERAVYVSLCNTDREKKQMRGMCKNVLLCKKTDNLCTNSDDTNYYHY